MTAQVAVETSGLAVSVEGRWVIKDLDIILSRGEFTAVVGPNGAGKTSLLRALVGLEPAWGEIGIGGVPMADLDPRTRARAIAYLPQGHIFHWPMAVVDIVALGRLPHGSGFRGLAASDVVAVEQAMADTQILALADRPVTSLSGGERARVALARALAVGAPVLLADEPAASLDPQSQIRMMETLRHQADDGVAIVAVFQDLALAARYADRVLVLHDGDLVADGPPATALSEDLLRRVFGVGAVSIPWDGGTVLAPSTIDRTAVRGTKSDDKRRWRR